MASNPERKPSIFIGDKRYEVGYRVYIHQHSQCFGNRGMIIDIDVPGGSVQVKCDKCGKDDVVIDVPTTAKHG